MPQKITELQNQLEKIIKGKKDITDKILMNLIIKGKHKKTLIFPVFSGNSVFYSDSCLVVV